jgi:hypothetical protein
VPILAALIAPGNFRRRVFRAIHRQAKGYCDMDVPTNPRFIDSAHTAKTYSGSCFCGAVELTVSGEPAAMGYCHCESCRSWSASPVNAFTLWKPEAVRITRGADNLGTFNKTPRSYRKWCKTCGGHLLTEHPHWGLIDVYAAIIPNFPFEAGVHVNYQETKHRIKDGLPKLKDVPAEMGGTGVSVAE